MCGPDILVAPVFEYQARQRRVYLPSGTDWTDVWSGETLSGGVEVMAEAPLERITVYVKDARRDLLQALNPSCPNSF